MPPHGSLNRNRSRQHPEFPASDIGPPNGVPTVYGNFGWSSTYISGRVVFIQDYIAPGQMLLQPGIGLEERLDNQGFFFFGIPRRPQSVLNGFSSAFFALPE